MINKPFFAAAAMSLVAGSVLMACGGSDDISVVTPTTLAEPFTIKVVGFNDYHGTLESPGTFGETTAVPAASRPAVGGAEFMAAHIASLKKKNPLNVVVGAGDSIGASPLISSLFFDEPSVETLSRRFAGAAVRPSLCRTHGCRPN